MIESPISDAKLAALGVTRESMLERIRNAVSFAAEHGITVAYFGVDGTRADLEFFRQAYETAIEAGAKEAVVVDTIGIATPEAVADLVGRTREWLGPDVPVHFHGHNDFGLATAAAAAAVRAGATWVQGTINGMGERGGNANLIEVALDARRALRRLDEPAPRPRPRGLAPRRRGLRHAARGVEAGRRREPLPRESGAVASQFHDPPAIEPYSSELVAAERSVVLGKKSGIDSIRIAVERLGLDVPEEQWPELLAKVKALGAEKRGLVTDDEF